jgi:hypothetical protein
VFQVENFFIETIVPHTLGIVEGSEAEIYAMPNAIMQKNADYFVLDSYLALKIIKTLQT